jgi:hypothetical protein
MINVPAIMAVAGIAMMLVATLGMWLEGVYSPPRED